MCTVEISHIKGKKDGEEKSDLENFFLYCAGHSSASHAHLIIANNNYRTFYGIIVFGRNPV